MRRRRFLMVAIGLIGLAGLLAACSSPGARGSAPTPTADASQLGPPTLALQAPSGDQSGVVGSYQWVTSQGVGANVQAHGYQFPAQPLNLKVGDSVTFVARGGSQPGTLSLDAYAQQGNVQPLATYAGTINAFIRPSSAALQTTLGGSPQVWKVDLKPGKYFLLLNGTWPSPIKTRTAPLTGQYVYSVNVSG